MVNMFSPKHQGLGKFTIYPAPDDRGKPCVLKMKNRPVYFSFLFSWALFASICS
jgi:hypothetical protein